LIDREFRREQRQSLKENRRFQRERLARIDRSVRERRRESERRKPEARWPYIVTALLFALSFAPVVGWANVVGFPVLVPFWVVAAARSSYRYRAYGVSLLFAFLNGGLSLFVQVAYIFQWP
jgi:hypothetical protein